LAEYPGIREAVVLARGEQGDQRLVAYYTGEESQAAEVLREHLGASLPDYMIPAAYVKLDSLPLTSNGKLDRKALPAIEFTVSTDEFVAPRFTVEAQIAAVWSRLFQVEKISVTANFFDLGGHSLSMVQMQSLLKQTGIEVSVATLFENPTVESLAAWIVRQGGVRMNSFAIPLRKSGSQLPLFLVHEVSGEMFYGSDLTRNIDAEIPAYGLAGQPLDEPPYRTVQAMASRLIRLIRAVQPEGPYRLAGWSFGGTLAYEIATQLIGADEKVEFLGLLDTYNSHGGADHSMEDIDDTDLLLETIASDGLDPAVLDEIKADSASMDFEQLVRKCQGLSLLPAHLTVEEFRNFFLRWRNHKIANIRYLTRKLPIPVYLFATQEDAAEHPFRNWDQVLPTDQIRRIPVPGSHQTMVEPPHIESLGEALSQAIREASNHPYREEEPRHSPVVVMQTGKAGVTPVFCVPGAGGSVVGFTELSLALGSTRPVYGLQPRGLDGEVPHSTVQAAARFYLQAIQKAYPEGPLHLLGHSFGGWVVFDLARCLTDSGRTVSSLTLVDTEAPDEETDGAWEYSETEIVMKLAEIYEQSIGLSLEIDPGELDALDGEAQLEFLHGRLVAVGLMPKLSEPEALRGTLRTFASCLRTSYRPEAIYSGAVRLVLVGDDRLTEKADRQLRETIIAGWKRWAPELTVCRGGGNHMSVLKPPHVKVLVDGLLEEWGE
ncbi:MAG: alpha/beta fold hydrolase, partial [Methylococcaceae bacterium]|nr:alpha/beta fold hydrolase [Methylococcaceae bacterium]